MHNLARSFVGWLLISIITDMFAIKYLNTARQWYIISVIILFFIDSEKW